MADAVPSDSVFVIIELQEVYDEAAIKEYRTGAHEQIVHRGGEMVGRGGSVIEGDPAASAMTIQRWKSAKDFIDWQESEEYRPFKDLRMKAMKLRISIVPAA